MDIILLLTENKRYDSHIITTVSPTITGQTGIPDRSDRSYIDTDYTTGQTGLPNRSDRSLHRSDRLVGPWLAQEPWPDSHNKFMNNIFS